MDRKEYLPLFDAICSVLDIYEPEDAKAKFTGLLSRVNHAIKLGEIDFSYSEMGSRYLHVEKLKEWSADYLDGFSLIETQEKKKLDNLNKANQDTLKRLKINNDTELLVKADKYDSGAEAWKKGAEKTNQKKRAAKEHCIELAASIWSEDGEDIEDVFRLKEICELLKRDLERYPDMFQPALDTIRDWLKDAESRSELFIPDAAKRPGRYKKRN